MASTKEVVSALTREENTKHTKTQTPENLDYCFHSESDSETGSDWDPEVEWNKYMDDLAKELDEGLSEDTIEPKAVVQKP